MHSLYLLFVWHIWTGTFSQIFNMDMKALKFQVCQNYVRYKYPCNTFKLCFKENAETRGSKHRSMISILNKIFDNHLTVFKVFADTAANFTYFFIALNYNYTYTLLLVTQRTSVAGIFAFLFVCFFACSFVLVFILLLLLVCQLSLFLCICCYLLSYGLAFCTIILL